jgi:hypothetical protein
VNINEVQKVITEINGLLEYRKRFSASIKEVKEGFSSDLHKPIIAACKVMFSRIDENIAQLVDAVSTCETKGSAEKLISNANKALRLPK